MIDNSLQYKGVVIALRANYVVVKVTTESYQNLNLDDDNNLKSKKFLCTIRKKLIYNRSCIYVGDHVFLDSIDCSNFTAVVSDVLPRNSFLSRPSVANVSDVIVVLSMKEPLLDFDQASRFLLTAEQSHLNITLVLSKSDLIELVNIEKYIQRFLSWGYNPLVVSLKDQYGIEDLMAKLTSNKLSVLCGPSGVGKSSLINYFLPEEALTISDVSQKLKRGRNTTRNVDLYSLSLNSLVADTPGFNRPDLSIEPYVLPSLFPELRTQIEELSCKFRNCLHRDEPGCLLDKSWDRYPQYRSILEEMIILNRQSQAS